MPRAYLDHASTSPPRPEVVDALIGALTLADPGRVHTEGRIARAVLEDAREKVALFCGTRSRQVIFCSGATEAINAAVYGSITSGRGDHIVCAGVEHSAVRRASERAGRVTVTGADAEGRIDAQQLLDAIGPDTALVHCQWANHEVGTVQPVAEVVAACRERGVMVHVDAAAAAGHLPIVFDDLGADLMSLSAHKFGGPKGAGALLIRRGMRLPPFLVGGEQERGRRGGLEDLPAWVGFGAAAELLSGAAVTSEASRAAEQTERLRAGARAVSGVRTFGPPEAAERLPHLVCLGIDGIEAEAVLLGLDQAGVAAHSGSACSSESLEPSPVLAAMGVDADHSLRLSVGWSTTDAEVAAAICALPAVISRLRALAPDQI
ncbi:MAG TPA: cysteine desulfurase family protein [Acidimicrobiales bacterium]|nr:cysteine desulfurase family protein [Acidimicrobiales bacterium]